MTEVVKATMTEEEFRNQSDLLIADLFSDDNKEVLSQAEPQIEPGVDAEFLRWREETRNDLLDVVAHLKLLPKQLSVDIEKKVKVLQIADESEAKEVAEKAKLLKEKVDLIIEFEKVCSIETDLSIAVVEAERYMNDHSGKIDNLDLGMYVLERIDGIRNKIIAQTAVAVGIPHISSPDAGIALEAEFATVMAMRLGNDRAERLIKLFSDTNNEGSLADLHNQINSALKEEADEIYDMAISAVNNHKSNPEEVDELIEKLIKENKGIYNFNYALQFDIDTLKDEYGTAELKIDNSDKIARGVLKEKGIILTSEDIKIEMKAELKDEQVELEKQAQNEIYRLLNEHGITDAADKQTLINQIQSKLKDALEEETVREFSKIKHHKKVIMAGVGISAAAALVSMSVRASGAGMVAQIASGISGTVFGGISGAMRSKIRGWFNPVLEKVKKDNAKKYKTLREKKFNELFNSDLIKLIVAQEVRNSIMDKKLGDAESARDKTRQLFEFNSNLNAEQVENISRMVSSLVKVRERTNEKLENVISNKKFNETLKGAGMGMLFGAVVDVTKAFSASGFAPATIVSGMSGIMTGSYIDKYLGKKEKEEKVKKIVEWVRKIKNENNYDNYEVVAELQGIIKSGVLSDDKLVEAEAREVLINIYLSATNSGTEGYVNEIVVDRFEKNEKENFKRSKVKKALAYSIGVGLGMLVGAGVAQASETFFGNSHPATSAGNNRTEIDINHAHASEATKIDNSNIGKQPVETNSVLNKEIGHAASKALGTTTRIPAEQEIYGQTNNQESTLTNVNDEVVIGKNGNFTKAIGSLLSQQNDNTKNAFIQRVGKLSGWNVGNITAENRAELLQQAIDRLSVANANGINDKLNVQNLVHAGNVLKINSLTGEWSVEQGMAKFAPQIVSESDLRPLVVSEQALTVEDTSLNTDMVETGEIKKEIETSLGKYEVTIDKDGTWHAEVDGEQISGHLDSGSDADDDELISTIRQNENPLKDYNWNKNGKSQFSDYLDGDKNRTIRFFDDDVNGRADRVIVRDKGGETLFTSGNIKGNRLSIDKTVSEAYTFIDAREKELAVIPIDNNTLKEIGINLWSSKEIFHSVDVQQKIEFLITHKDEMTGGFQNAVDTLVLLNSTRANVSPQEVFDHLDQINAMKDIRGHVSTEQIEGVVGILKKPTDQTALNKIIDTPISDVNHEYKNGVHIIKNYQGQKGFNLMVMVRDGQIKIGVDGPLKNNWGLKGFFSAVPNTDLSSDTLLQAKQKIYEIQAGFKELSKIE